MSSTQIASQALLLGSLTRHSHYVKFAPGKGVVLLKESFPPKQLSPCLVVGPWASPSISGPNVPFLQDERTRLDGPLKS